LRCIISFGNKELKDLNMMKPCVGVEMMNYSKGKKYEPVIKRAYMAGMLLMLVLSGFVRQHPAAQTPPQKEAILSKSYLSAYKLDSAKGNYIEAINNYRNYMRLKDSISDITKSKQIAQLQTQYQTKKKDKELKNKEQNINLLQRQAQLQQTNLEQERTSRSIIIGSVVLLCLLLGLSYNRYRLKRRINLQLQTQQNEINLKNNRLQNLLREKDNLLVEKEWLMKEIHHRVKNNLQIVISLLNTQSSYLNNDVAVKAIRESQHRMQSISLIHQKLYQSENLALVNMQVYVSDLIDYLSVSFNTENHVVFETDIAALEFDVTRAVPLGLILNEAITNSIKYAFPAKKAGKITITLLQSSEEKFSMKISDNGIGLPYQEDISGNKTLGISLMRGLAKQLGGTFRIESNPGLSILIDFENDSFLKQFNN